METLIEEDCQRRAAAAHGGRRNALVHPPAIRADGREHFALESRPGFCCSFRFVWCGRSCTSWIFFSLMFSRKPLITSGGPPRERAGSALHDACWKGDRREKGRTRRKVSRRHWVREPGN